MKRLLLCLIPAALFALGIREQRKPEDPATTAVGLEDYSRDRLAEAGDPPGGYRNGILTFLYFAGGAAVAGVLVRKWIVPALGDRLSDALFSGDRGADDSRVRARTLAEDGKFPAALVALARAVRDYPGDRTLPADIARIHLEELNEPDTAIRVLETALARDWNARDRSWLTARLADAWDEGRKDIERARDLLLTAVTMAPGTPEASAALESLRDLDERERERTAGEAAV